MSKNSIDLASLLPPRYRDKTLDTLLRNVFNRHLSKPDTTSIFGYVGDSETLTSSDNQILEENLERQLNQLVPFIVAEHASEKIVFSWNDLVKKMSILGIDTDRIGDWFSTKSYNFVPPIDLDKFCNFYEYYWVGNWILNYPSSLYSQLGIQTDIEVFNSYGNSDLNPEYYTIERNGSTNDWQLTNLWVHKDSVIEFINNNGATLGVGFKDLVQATRPIIEYSSLLKLNSKVDGDGRPSDVGTDYVQKKVRKSQLPMFDLYRFDGSHTGTASAIFYYQESQSFDLDPVLERRVVIDSGNDFVFEHSLVDKNTQELYFYKSNNSNHSDSEEVSYELRTIWRSGPDISSSYKKYDTAGTIINQDKFKNYKNYFWVGVDSENNPSYNKVGSPEYVVIEPGGSSDWSIYNHWKHVSSLNRSDLKKYVQAKRPIIEFNVFLEPELVTAKTSFNELPKFKHYVEDSGSYHPIPFEFKNDSYLAGHLFTKISDLGMLEDVILASPDVLKSCLKFEDEYYLQGLFSGSYELVRDGIEYGFKYSTFYRGTGNGSFIYNEVNTGQIKPELITLECTQVGKFKATGSVSGVLGTLNLGVNSVIQGIQIKITEGTVPFKVGDKFILEVKSYVYEERNLYVKIDGTYRTLSSPEEIINEANTVRPVLTNPENKDGSWTVPPQVEWNIQNETRPSIKQGDLYYHFISIIEAQRYTTTERNWNSLTEKNVGLGGKIKQFDGSTSLFISLLMQEGITVGSILEFARKSYESFSVSIREFVETELPRMLNSGEVSPDDALTGQGNVIEAFKKFFLARSPIVEATSSSADDNVSTPFYDTTSSIKNLVATLPYLGLTNKVQPEIYFDGDLNLYMLRHHDGHCTQLQSFNVELAKKIVQMEFERSPGQLTQGVIGGVSYPDRPYKGQFWFKTSSNELFLYNVVSDRGELPEGSQEGTYSFDRESKTVWKKTSTGWTQLGSSLSAQTEPWRKIDLDQILQTLELSLERDLYENCPELVERIPTADLESDPAFNSLLKQELENFGVKYGTTNVYSTVFDPDNPFTWNYSSLGSHAAWQDIYQEVYGTSRPDLYPWIMAGFNSETELLNYLISRGDIPASTSKFDASLWNSSAGSIRLRLVGTTKLSIDPSTGVLIPPYSFSHPESLFGVPPSTPNSLFEFGDLGPVERFWRKTLDFLYSKQKVYFKLSPLSYVRDTWGVKRVRAGEYLLDPILERKPSISDVALHNDRLEDLLQPSWISVEVLSPPNIDVVYKLKCVSRIDDVFQIEACGQKQFMYGSTFSDPTISVVLTPSSRGFFHGDEFEVTVKTDGTFYVSVRPQSYYQAEGLNQLYVQYNRLYVGDLQVSKNKTLLNGWGVKLGYRMSGLVNTDNLVIKSQDSLIDDSAFEVHLKENKFYRSVWIDALRVQLVAKGSTDLVNGISVPRASMSGEPGVDWVFRIDNYNDRRTTLSWYEYDLDGESSNFIALNGERTSYPWKKYHDKKEVKTYSAPFLVTGIQNLINFVVGYSEKKYDEGWRVFDPRDPKLDANTGKIIDYQFLIEKFVDQVFSGVDAGYSYVFNPFSRKVWYETNHGVVSSLQDVIGLEQETVCTVLNETKRQIPTSDIRVFRNDELTQFVFDQPVYTLHVLLSEYEHVLLLEDYSVSSLLIYDPFLGQKVSNLYLEMARQANFTGKLDFGGHYLLHGEMKKNIETSISDISRLYDTTVSANDRDLSERARALLGFEKKSYFSKRGTLDQSEFRFWQGMVSNKGTNFSVSAFLNTSDLRDTKLDEFWAYKLAEYGDARRINRLDLKVSLDQCLTERTTYKFLIDSLGTDELIDSTGCIEIDPRSESDWFSYSDLGKFSGFELSSCFEKVYVPLEQTQVFYDAKNSKVRADYYELEDLSYVEDSDGFDMAPYDFAPYDLAMSKVLHEDGEYVEGTNPPIYLEPKFERVNHSTIHFSSQYLLGHTLKIKGYAPNAKRYSPNAVIDYVDNVTMNDRIIWWDPGRGVFNPQAAREIDVDLREDPAVYTDMVLDSTSRKMKSKSWGEQQVGTVWWNTQDVWWKPYSDTKIYPNLQERLIKWGTLSDASTLEVYEWVKSSKHPSEAQVGESTDGEPAVSYYVKRERKWWQRPVAWLYSENPVLIPRDFLVRSPDQIMVNVVQGRGTAILKSKTFKDLGMEQGIKFSQTYYDDSSTVIQLKGCATVSSSSTTPVVGSQNGYDDGGKFFVDDEFIKISVSLDKPVVEFRSCYGKYVLSNYSKNEAYFLKLTHVETGTSQELQVHDIPFESVLDFYNFDTLGIKIFYQVPDVAHLNSVYGITTEAARKSMIASFLGFPGHEIFVRDSIEITTTIPFVRSTEELIIDEWVAWKDPESNPALTSDQTFNLYEPVFGNWVEVGKRLNDLSADIIKNQSIDWTWYDGSDVGVYKSTWSNWVKLEREIIEAQYLEEDQNTFCRFNFSSDLTTLELLKRVNVYVNETRLLPSEWTVVDSTTLNGYDLLPYDESPYDGYRKYVLVNSPLKFGDFVKVIISPEVPSEEQLSFDPVLDIDPFRLNQYKRDYPCVIESRRDENDKLSIVNYYYWVKNKTNPAVGKNSSVVKIAQQLREFDGTYSVPQGLRFFDQLLGISAKHTYLSFKNLGQVVKTSNRFKIRLNDNPTLRSDDSQMSLKNVHTEWALIRIGQTSKIQIELWNKVIDTLIGSNQVGQQLPYTSMQLYDQKHSSSVRYGFNDGQILTDSEIAIATVKHVIANPSLDKYDDNGNLVPDYIDFVGFDLEKLNDYFSTPDSIRMVMSDIWRNAKPSQVNEIFFAVLEDAAAKNLELSDFFKTSYVSMNDVNSTLA